MGFEVPSSLAGQMLTVGSKAAPGAVLSLLLCTESTLSPSGSVGRAPRLCWSFQGTQGKGKLTFGACHTTSEQS